MVNYNQLQALINNMTEDINSNIKKIKKVYGSIKYKDEDNQSLLHIFVDHKFDENKCFLAIKSLLEIGLSPNLEDDFKYNFIQTALYAGYSESFIIKIIQESLKYRLNVNHVDSDKDTIMHTAIYSDDYLGALEAIYELLCANGFDSTKICGEGRNLLEAMHYQKQYTPNQIQSFEGKFSEKIIDEIKETSSVPVKQPITNNNKVATPTVNNASIKQQSTQPNYQTLSDKDISELEKYGKVLNKKKYIVAPTIGREKELKNLMITLAQDKKNPLIVGESGVGKTSLVDELAYRIQKQEVPNFLQGKIILEVNPNDIVAGCQYVGQFEENMSKLMKICEKNKAIIFIDEIHTIYRIGSTKGKDNDMAAMLKHYIDRTDLKVIGTTTQEEYNEYFCSDALKRRFEKIIVQEPTEDILYKIINKVIKDYTLENAITFENEHIKEHVINIIINATEKSHRDYIDIVNNPDLSISIIDKAFAVAKVYNSEFITIKHFIESFEYCDRIYESAREQAIAGLKKIDNNKEKPKSKILKPGLNMFKK